MALEDATVENGCLTAIAGSHTSPLRERFVRNKKNTGTEFVSHTVEETNWNLAQIEALEVKKGDPILLHGQLVHASFANRSPKSRHAFVLHMVKLNNKWPENNWLQRPKSFPFRIMENVVYQPLS